MRSLGTVLCLQVGQLTELQGTHDTGIHTNRILSLRLKVLAEVALRHITFFLIELRCAVRTSPFAVPAADALICINQDDPVLALGNRGNRTDLFANWVLAVHACRRQRIHKYIVRDHQIRILEDP